MNQIDFWYADEDLRNLKDGVLSWMCLKMISANQIVEFLNQFYLKKKLMSQFEFWHIIMHSRNKKLFLIFSIVEVKNRFHQSECWIFE